MAVWDFISEFVIIYKDFILTLPPLFQIFVNLFVLVLIIIVYSVFVWKLHKFIATKNIFKFDLNKYNTTEHPVLTKLIASGFYLLEYIVIIPFIIFFWFAIFTFFLILFIEDPVSIENILLISAIAIASIRMASYIPGYGENLARKIAEILAFTFLAVSILDPQIFTNLIERVSQRFSEMPLFFSGAVNYLVFIIILEVALRLFEFLFSIMGIGDVPKEKEE